MSKTQAVVKGFYDKDTNTISYVLSCPTTLRCAIIDSVLEFQTNGGKTTIHPVESILSYIKGMLILRVVFWHHLIFKCLKMIFNFLLTLFIFQHEILNGFK